MALKIEVIWRHILLRGRRSPGSREFWSTPVLDSLSCSLFCYCYLVHFLNVNSPSFQVFCLYEVKLNLHIPHAVFASFSSLCFVRLKFVVDCGVFYFLSNYVEVLHPTPILKCLPLIFWSTCWSYVVSSCSDYCLCLFTLFIEQVKNLIIYWCPSLT